MKLVFKRKDRFAFSLFFKVKVFETRNWKWPICQATPTKSLFLSFNSYCIFTKYKWSHTILIRKKYFG